MTVHNSPAPRRLPFSGLLVAIALLAGHAPASHAGSAQQETQPESQQPALPPDAVSVEQMLRQADALPPAQRLGVRSAIIRNAQIVVPDLVVVRTPLEAAEAISRWQGIVRFPVLIDDGSDGAAEDIARFVRAFGPRKVVRWSKESDPWPADAFAQEQRITQYLGDAFETPSVGGGQRTIFAGLKAQGLAPNGVVAVDPNDATWVAGLALAAARIQPIVFVESTGRVRSTCSPEAAERMVTTIGSRLDELGLTWRTLGDDIDAVTLVMNTASKVNDAGHQGPNTQTAISDRIARVEGIGSDRWAWGGLIFGSPADALYRAMCGLFLPVRSAWLFDTYPTDGEWANYSLAPAAELFRTAGLGVTLFDRPNNRLPDWRTATARGLGAEILMINSKGMASAFDVGGVDAKPGDIPILRNPAIGIMVHSWSTAAPDDPDTIAGRFLANGAYAWFGSVQEPFLSAFLPNRAVAERLLTGAPLGAAVRYDEQPVWKLNLIGDPLIVVSRPTDPGRRAGNDLWLESTTDLEDEMREALRSRNFAEAIRTLTMLGRDQDAVRLARALMKDQPERFSATVASYSILPLYRMGEFLPLAEAYTYLDGVASADRARRDALWHSARALPTASIGSSIEQLLMQTIRDGQQAEDALEVSTVIRRLRGPKAAADYLGLLASRTSNARLADRLRRWSNEYIEGRR